MRVERLSPEKLSAVIGEIYDCVLNPDGWGEVMTRITEAMDAAYSTIALSSTTDNHGRFAAQSPWDPAQMRALQEDYSFDDIPGLRAAVMGDMDVPVATLSSMSEAALQATPFFRNWAGPQQLREACMVKFVHTPDRIGLLGCTTRASRDVISAEECRFLALLSPHLRRAAMIGDLLDQARVNAHLFRETLNGLSTAVLLTGADGRILHANQAAEAMLVAGGPLQSKSGILQAGNPLAGRALLEAIARAADADDRLGERGIGLPISAPGAAPAVAYVLPLSEGTARAAFRPACAAIFISTTISASPLPEAVLTTLFDLTQAEARVLIQIGGGKSSADTARSLGITENTLKTHLGRVYAKTNTRRQAELVRLLSSIRTPLGAPGPIASAALG
ncbi:helix-turn-helix transcriptional regulator [Sphingomonas psychrotolerans]|uniref:LuxR family transcriptional regulator n=1 Tax=Sphingomonas psychrotolerans TaxID=1327635 RepID=A0A2K8MJA7_9SPHN|nr:LuxR C-terminal-related transcriptional regulator [Sphingomonas psychrotolerans]ATY33957.1 LuxR family transcriptional regulator [Sphingomonas psychrotolerans]